MPIAASDQPHVARLKAAAAKGVKPFLAAYAPTIAKIHERDSAYYHDPCPTLFEKAVAAKRYADAKQLLDAYVAYGLDKAKPNPIVLSGLGAKAIDLAIATKDPSIFELAQQRMRPKDAEFELLFNIARWHALHGARLQMLKSIIAVLKSYGVPPSTFTSDKAFASYARDDDFKAAIKGKLVAPKASGGLKAAKVPAVPKGMISWDRKPKAAEVYGAVTQFFDALRRGKVAEAKPLLAHDEGFDETMRSLFEEVAGFDPAYERQKRWNADLGWLANVKIGKLQTDRGKKFDADEHPDFFVSLSYGRTRTSATADFEVRDIGPHYVVACTIIHVM